MAGFDVAGAVKAGAKAMESQGGGATKKKKTRGGIQAVQAGKAPVAVNYGYQGSSGGFIPVPKHGTGAGLSQYKF
jgi:hypothetical protein